MASAEEVGALVQRIVAMESALNQTQAIVVTLRETLETEREKVETLEKKAEERKNSRNNMTNRKGFTAVPKYSGKAEEYDDWKFKVTTFLGEEPFFRELLQWIEDRTEEFDELEVEEWAATKEGMDIKWMNNQLYTILSLNLVGPALALIKNLCDDLEVNGMRGWWKITQEFAGMTAQRLQGLASRVYTPPRCKTVGEVITSVETWENLVRMFEKAEKQSLSQQTKIHGIKQLVPEELSKSIRMQSHTLKTYSQVRAYVMEQAAMRRDPNLPKHLGGEPVPMDIGHVDCEMNKETNEHTTEHQGENGVEAYAVMKGKGKGKGKEGEFSGTCHHCGEWGHRLNACPRKDEEMKQWRAAKGKGNEKGSGGAKGEWSYGGAKGGWSPDPSWNYGKGGYAPQWWWPNPKGKGKSAPKGHGGWNYGKGAYAMWDPTAVDPGPVQLCTITEEYTIPVHNRWSVLEEDEQEDAKEHENTFEGGRRSAEEVPQYLLETPATLSTCLPCKELHHMGSWKTQPEAGWTKIKAVVDSGAGASVAPPSMAPNIPVKESEATRRGQHFASASGNSLPNMGEQIMEVTTDEGSARRVKFQVAEVTRPLCAVSAMCAQGNRVVFEDGYGMIVNKNTGEVTPIWQEDGIYTINLWMNNGTGGEQPGFYRQG